MNSTVKRKSKRKPKKVFDHLWYIVDILHIDRPRLLHNHFASEIDARRSVRKFLSNNFTRFDVIGGKKANANNIRFATKRKKDRKTRVRSIRVVKYQYPKELVTLKARSKYREKLRKLKKTGKKIKQHQITINESKAENL